MQTPLKVADVGHKITPVKKPALSFWQIWNMSFGFLGIQFGFALQQANVPRIFQTMGAELDKIGYLMIAAPLAGLLVQPIIGYMSDRTWGRWGRRRPYFILGALFASLALCGMPNATALWVAAALLLILDVAINVAMEPFRAFVGDLLPKEQVTKGYAFQTFFIGIGAVVASALPYILTHAFGVSNTGPAGEAPPSVTLAFYLGAAAFFGAVAWTVFRTKEYSPEQVRQYHPEAEPIEQGKSGIASFFSDYRHMPKIMQQLSLVQFFTWFTWFSMWTYATAAITQHIYGTTDTTSALFNEGADWWGVCSAVYNAASIAFAFLLPVIARKTSRKAAHAVALAVGGMSFISIYFVSSPAMLVLPFIGIGLAWASTLSMPYAILACATPAHKMGMFMGMFNMSIVIPQLVSGLTLGYFLTRFFEGQAIMMLILAGVSMLIAACLSMVVKELD
ncbi:MFS transporter [Massilia sp. PAMC28688]|uniref:MFS transporter n=1 Tax=Massilia sp. PAMC28688 TaxID=2861283 RepID=UPI001C633CBE|nr:MFS transporter [Massilia sp. PAMC28688]QYF92921.1 MFS transporter [Massilia sp. PAMC28688]